MPDGTGETSAGGGPLRGLRVLEFAAIGPVPHAAMVLADLGADVVCVDRPGPPALALGKPGTPDPLQRGRRRVVLDLKAPEGRATALELVARADVLLEGLRPGVMERLGLGPDVCRARNPRLVYARMTGWGQDGPLAGEVGHDLNYIGLTGVLHAIGRAGGPPPPPLNLVGDFGGGSMLLLIGVLAALWERDRSGQGQVIDAAMVDGASLLAQLMMSMRARGAWRDERASNLLDGGAPFYDTYACADGKFVAVGALEPRFFAALLQGLGLTDIDPARQADVACWPELRRRFTEAFATRTRDEWAAHFAGTEACVTPVLTFAEAAEHPHLMHRRTYVVADGMTQAGTAPRFSRTPGAPGRMTPAPVPAAEALAPWRPAA
ncbi:MAG: CoA transferase, partial [Micromonosporaceae bacterium]|nr:CoA transferase [Micromonosporaceae bacterium]